MSMRNHLRTCLSRGVLDHCVNVVAHGRREVKEAEDAAQVEAVRALSVGRKLVRVYDPVPPVGCCGAVESAYVVLVYSKDLYQ